MRRNSTNQNLVSCLILPFAGESFVQYISKVKFKVTFSVLNLKQQDQKDLLNLPLCKVMNCYINCSHCEGQNLTEVQSGRLA